MTTIRYRIGATIAIGSVNATNRNGDALTVEPGVLYALESTSLVPWHYGGGFGPTYDLSYAFAVMITTPAGNAEGVYGGLNFPANNPPDYSNKSLSVPVAAFGAVYAEWLELEELRGRVFFIPPVGVTTIYIRASDTNTAPDYADNSGTVEYKLSYGIVYSDSSSARTAMPNLTADEIITNKHVRDFVQWKGAGPTNPPAYYGMDAQFFKMEGLSMPDGQGSISPRYMHDPRKIGKFKLVARQVSAPDLNAANMVLTERHGAIPRQLQRINCPVNIYENIGECKDPSDFVSGWSDYVLVYENGLVDGNKDGGNRSAWGDADDQLEDSLPMKFDDIYPIGALAFGDNATGIITLEVIDVIYVKANDCVDCDDWWIYAVTESSGSTPGTAPRLIYSTDNGETWSQASIDSLGDTEDPSGIDQVGKYLVVYTRTAGGATTSGYYYSEINQNTGAPGTWTKVTTGFVAGFQVRDMFVLSPREVFFCADDGYIYFSDDITAGVSVRSASAATTADLYRIHGENETIVSCGIGGIVVVSQNRGKTFSVTTASPVVATLQALCVVNDSTWWIGSATGKLYYTQTGGEVWTEKTFSGSGAGQVYDIIKVSPSVLFFSHSTATPTGRVFSTWNGGRDWTNSAPRILNMPTANRFNRLATPPTDAGVAANNIAVAGLGGNGTDGILLLGIAARL